MNVPITQYPIPKNESQRLRAVRSYEILDTLPEVDFDTLLRVALHAFNAPAGVIGLMDTDRLWFKSQIGIGLPQLDRQIAFCTHAIMRPGELLVVEDLLNDLRFERNPLVTHVPNLRFYAGAPLIERNGYALGTIAVVDTQPRTFNESQRAALRDLSILVITALESRHRANLLGHLAMTDHLTGLANRAQFERTLLSEIAYARRTGEPFTVFYMDLDNFKGVNDTLGHAAGDEVLCVVAQRLTDQVRAEDLLARLGGDEFGIFMRPSVENSAESLAKRVIDVVSAPIILSTGDKVSVGISIGIATYTDAIDSMATLMAQADQALYEDKRKNGD
ncbi:MAG: Diguanylate cyclase with GAF sensor [Candidatus Gallionella acididurans]|uniref:Diguanylate cyclase with GAF sensor n=1 Tax=Candidatus Gallionella acididurans TaxID=1796491 RepID=A0A139BNX4_9PROT|nr:MAG: Diguanylate cyclase with GAF sensor [Candidatus Gallionella acididurans]